jgi:hypothetical protein
MPSISAARLRLANTVSKQAGPITGTSQAKITRIEKAGLCNPFRRANHIDPMTVEIIESESTCPATVRLMSTVFLPTSETQYYRNLDQERLLAVAILTSSPTPSNV